MFSGIVLEQGVLKNISPLAKSIRIAVSHSRLPRKVSIGESVAVNGCCLTLVSNRQGFEFDILKESWKRTSLQHARVFDKVNLELALKLGDPVGGHLVTGHIDEVGRITARQSKGSDILIEIEASSSFMRWIVRKGSVAVDGVSLTVCDVKKRHFTVWVIPHTLKLTTLGWKRKNDLLNLEGDMFAKYAQNAVIHR
jgi:riboflavin synthase